MKHLIDEIIAEREQQRKKWSLAHDLQHTLAEWVYLIVTYLGQVEVFSGYPSRDTRKAIVVIGALALAILEVIDRRHCTFPGQDAIEVTIRQGFCFAKLKKPEEFPLRFRELVATGSNEEEAIKRFREDWAKASPYQTADPTIEFTNPAGDDDDHNLILAKDPE